jgi:hypothetical protein
MTGEKVRDVLVETIRKEIYDRSEKIANEVMVEYFEEKLPLFYVGMEGNMSFNDAFYASDIASAAALWAEKNIQLIALSVHQYPDKRYYKVIVSDGADRHVVFINFSFGRHETKISRPGFALVVTANYGWKIRRNSHGNNYGV